jgi:hypothetical protein
MVGRTDLLAKYGPQSILAAAEDVADYVGDVDEIGSSDVSGWVKQVERMLEENPPEAFGVKEDVNPEDVGEYDREGDMAKSDLRSIMLNAGRLHDMLGDGDNLPEWVQSKLTVAEDYLSTVVNYLSAQAAEPMADMPESVTEGSNGSLAGILARHADAVEEFKKGGDMGYDLESDLWDYYFSRGDIRNYDADASEWLTQRLADELGLDESVAEGLPQTLRKFVPGYAKREIDKKMDAGKFGKTDADKDANFQRYKKIQDKLKEQGVAEGGIDPNRHPQTLDYGRGESDFGEPREILEDVLTALEREVEWPLTEIMDRREVQQLLQPIRSAVNAELRIITRKKNKSLGVAEGKTGNAGYDSMLAVMKAVDAGTDATFDIAGEPITLEYPEARFLAGKYKAFLKAGRQEEFLKYMENPVTFDRLMKQLRDLIDKQKNFRGSVPGERGVNEKAMGDSKLEKYITNYPEEVSSSLDELKKKVEADAQQSRSRFNWAIGKMPDGRYVSGLAGAIKGFGLPIAAQGSSTDFFEAKNPYAIGMAQAMKSTGDTPPLKKSTIKKAHKIADAIKANESLADNEYWCKLDKKVKLVPEGYKKLATGYITRI